eukprot:31059-Pelagococcus_subviridis.AAC.1
MRSFAVDSLESGATLGRNKVRLLSLYLVGGDVAISGVANPDPPTPPPPLASDMFAIASSVRFVYAKSGNSSASSLFRSSPAPPLPLSLDVDDDAPPPSSSSPSPSPSSSRRRRPPDAPASSPTSSSPTSDMFPNTLSAWSGEDRPASLPTGEEE